jgi:CHAT domain-containing protein
MCSLAFAQEGNREQDTTKTNSDDPRGIATGAAANVSPVASNQAVAIAQARMRDMEAVATLTAEGKALYQAESNKGSFTDYKYGAYTLLEKGEFRQAIRKAAVSLFLSINQGNDTQIAYAKLIIASAYLAAGDTNHAQIYASEAKNHSIYPTYRSDVLSTAEKILGDAALKQGDYDKAIAFYDQSIDLALGDQRFYSRVAQAQALASTKSFDKAKDAVRKAEGYLGVIPLKYQAEAKGSLLRIRGMVALAEGKTDEAIQLYEDALKAQGSDEDAVYDRFWILEGLGRGKLAKGDSAGALKAYLQAIDLSDTIRSRFRSEEVRSALFGEMQDVFGQATRLLIEAGQVEAAWEVNERGRGRALLDLLRNRVQLAAGNTVLAEASGKSIKLQELVTQLKPGEVVVSYRILNGRTYAWVTRKTGTKAVTINIGRKDLIQRVQEYRDAIVENKANTKILGASLHDALIKPLGIWAGEAVAIIPHDALHYLPFQALWTGEQYLLQRAAISYAPSANALISLTNRQPSKTSKFFGLGNPDVGDPNFALPGAQKEVEAITGLFQNSETYFRKEATRDRFHSGSPQARLVHIAAHGTVDPVDPLYSKLHLAKEADHPGTVEARDIYALRFDNAELVVLSACETGLGTVSSGDEIWGFTRSFLSAGAPALLVSLWPVSDEATEILMKRFYGDLSKGKSKRQALRDAELAVLADPRFSSPFYWAAFNLVGDSR